MRDWALLIRSLAWPIVALTAMATFRLELVGIFSAIKRQIENAKRFKGRAFGASFELASEVTQRLSRMSQRATAPRPSVRRRSSRAKFTSTRMSMIPMLGRALSYGTRSQIGWERWRFPSA